MSSIQGGARAAHGLGARAFAAVFALGLVIPASALPPSLRTDDDVGDTVDAVMRSVEAGRVAAGIRALGAYTALSADALAERTIRIEREHSQRRKRLGLVVAVEEIESRRVGERLWRVTRLQHFDKGHVAWRFVFHRPAQSWQLLDLEVVENDPRLFGDPPKPAAAEASPPAAEKPERSSAPESLSTPAPGIR